MKRQTLHIGSALLATTALSSLASAAVIETADNTASASAAITPISLAAQVFGASGAANVSLGPVGINLDMTNALTSAFDIDLEVTNAKFSTASGPVTLLAFTEDASASLSAATFIAASQCTVQVLTERILVDNCVSTFNGNTCRIDVVQLSGIVFNQANGLATAGSSISLGGIVTGNTGNQTFELITSASVVTSANALTTSTATGGTSGSFTINNTATPPFSKLTGATTTSAIVGTVTVTPTNAIGTNLTTTLTISSNLVGGMEFTVTHGVLSDPATTEVHLSQAFGAQTQSVRASNFVSNTASFDVTAVNAKGTFEIEVNFDGTTAIKDWSAGSVSVVYTVGSALATAPTAPSGTLAAFSRGGFRAQLNTLQSSVVSGFDSFVRVTNNGSVSGFALIAVSNDSTGSSYGTFTTATIAPNSTVQISMPTIEAGIPIASPGGQYIVNITGAIQGYAQHVMLNTQNGTFVDMSGFRIGDATTGLP